MGTSWSWKPSGVQIGKPSDCCNFWLYEWIYRLDILTFIQNLPLTADALDVYKWLCLKMISAPKTDDWNPKHGSQCVVPNMIPHVCLRQWHIPTTEVLQAWPYHCMLGHMNYILTYWFNINHYISELGGGFKYFWFSPLFDYLRKIPILTSIFFNGIGSTTNQRTIDPCITRLSFLFALCYCTPMTSSSMLQWLARWPATKLFSKWWKLLLLGCTYYL